MIIFLLSSFFYLNVEAAGLEFTKGEFSTSALSIGVEHMNSSSTITNDVGTSSKQNINVVIKNNDAKNVKVVTWTKFTSSGAWTFGTVEDIARDFENKNPGYSVLAGVNGDYFAYSPSRSVNSNINANGDIIKASNHTKYLSVGINSSATDLVINKTMDFGSLYYLTIYEPNTNKILRVVKLQGLNAKALSADATTVYYNGTTINLDGAKKFVVKTPIGLSFMDTHLYAKGQISESTYENLTVSDKEFAVVTNDQTLLQLLDQFPIVRVQKMISGNLLNTNSVIGIDSQILKDGNVRSFTQIDGQSDSNNRSRHPRTSFGISENGSFIIATVDGRQVTGDAGVYSSGVDLRELALIMKSYGAVQAFNLDGGGSSEMVIKNESGEIETINSPSEGPNFPIGHTYHKSAYRSVANALLFVVPDINVQSNYSIITSNSLLLDYQINATSNISVEQSRLIVNSEILTLNEQSGHISLTNLIENGLNTVNFEFTYLKNGERFTKVFESKIIDLSIDSGNREPNEPTNFTVEFIDIEDTDNFEVKVCYVDTDKMITKLSVLLKNVNLYIPASSENDSCQTAIILNAKNNTTYEFNIKYFFNENSESRNLETTYSHTFKPNNEEPIDQEPIDEIPIVEKDNDYLLISIIGGFIILCASVTIYIVSKRRI
jgi:exopolysaccharide biosynthesis protein